MGFFSSRRDRIIEQELMRIAASGRTEGKAPHIHFDAARRYAQDHGGTLWDDMADSITFDAKIGERTYNIMFMELSPGRGTDITLMPPSDFSTTFFGENSPMHSLVKRCLSDAEPAIDRAIPVSDARYFLDRYGYGAGASWIDDQGIHSGAGIVDLPEIGRCFILVTVTTDRTIVAGQQAPHLEIHPDQRSEWFDQLTESVREWHAGFVASDAAAD